MRVETGPSVLFSKMAWQKMWALVHNCKIEISWFGYCTPDEEKEKLGIAEDYYVEDIYVVDQECTGVKSDMLPDAVSKLCIQLMDEDKDPSRLKVWGHSHVNMDVGFSGTDESTIEKLELEPLISIVLNKRGDVNIRCDIWKPFRHSADCTYAVEEIQLIPDSWAEGVIKEHVKKPKVTYVNNFGKSKSKTGKSNASHTSSYYGNWRQDDMWDDDWTYGQNLVRKAFSVNDKDESKPADPGLESALEYATYELNLPEEVDFLEEMFLKGELNINELLEAYAHYRLNNDSVESLMDFLTEEDPEAKAFVESPVEHESEESEYDNPLEDPFYVNENPGNKVNGTPVAEAK